MESGGYKFFYVSVFLYKKNPLHMMSRFKKKDCLLPLSTPLLK